MNKQNVITYLHSEMLFSHKMKYWYTLQHRHILQTFMLSEDVRLKSLYVVWFHLYELSRTGKARETESRLISLCQRDGQRGELQLMVNDHECSFWGDGSVLKLDNGNGCIPCEYTENHWVVYNSSLYCASKILYVCVCYKLEVCGNPVWSKYTGAIFPTAFAHFKFLCHVLVIFTVFQTFSWLLYLSWWSVSSAV